MRLILGTALCCAALLAQSQQCTRAPGQACAIPLLRVTPGETHDRMNVPRTAAGPSPDHMPVVAVPAPSCDDVKR